MRALKKIESQEEYDKQLKYYKKKIRRKTIEIKKFYKDPKTWIKEFEQLLEEMVYIGLIDIDYANEKRRYFYKEINSPHDFKAWLDDHKDKITAKIEKIKNKMSKNNGEKT